MSSSNNIFKKASTGSSTPSVDDYNYRFKLVILGDAQVGKSCIFERFTKKTYSEYSKFLNTMVGCDWRVRPVEAENGKRVNLQVWDSGHNYLANSSVSSHLRGAHAYIIVYDVTDLESYMNVKKHLDFIQAYNGDSLCVLVGNKCDLVSKKGVEEETAQEFAEQNKMSFIEVSAKTPINIELLFTTIAEELLKKYLHTEQEKYDKENPGPVTFKANAVIKLQKLNAKLRSEATSAGDQLKKILKTRKADIVEAMIPHIQSGKAVEQSIYDAISEVQKKQPDHEEKMTLQMFYKGVLSKCQRTCNELMNDEKKLSKTNVAKASFKK